MPIKIIERLETFFGGKFTAVNIQNIKREEVLQRSSLNRLYQCFTENSIRVWVQAKRKTNIVIRIIQYYKILQTILGQKNCSQLIQ